MCFPVRFRARTITGMLVHTVPTGGIGTIVGFDGVGLGVGANGVGLGVGFDGVGFGGAHGIAGVGGCCTPLFSRASTFAASACTLGSGSCVAACWSAPSARLRTVLPVVASTILSSPITATRRMVGSGSVMSLCEATDTVVASLRLMRSEERRVGKE